jgi:predicted nucleic acid-binding protein
MRHAWDTTVTSRAHGDGRHAELLETHLLARRPIVLPAPVVQEVVYGLEARSRHDEAFRRAADWFAALLGHALVRVVPFDGPSAVLSGRLLARMPYPPTGTRRRPGTRMRQRAAWALDVQIAACTFAGGYGVLTENVEDFGVLRTAIGELLPNVPPLVVTDARAMAGSPA